MYLNEVLLAGVLAREPVERVTDGGKQYVSTALRLDDPGDGARVFTTYVPLVAYGRAADQLRDLAEGAAILARGKLSYRSWTKDNKREGRLEVTCWTVQPIRLATPAAVAQN